MIFSLCFKACSSFFRLESKGISVLLVPRLFLGVIPFGQGGIRESYIFGFEAFSCFEEVELLFWRHLGFFIVGERPAIFLGTGPNFPPALQTEQGSGFGWQESNTSSRLHLKGILFLPIILRPLNKSHEFSKSGKKKKKNLGVL